MGSGALVLVNDVMSMTGDSKQLSTIAGSSGGIAERTVRFMNQVIADVEQMHNWAFLRTNAAGVANGVDDIFEFSGTEDVRVGGAVSVWIAGQGSLKELSPSQFDSVIGDNALTGSEPLYFQRGSNAAGTVQVQIYPVPASGTVINLSAYKEADRFDANDDASTTQFDDAVIRYGALMHTDAYDGLDRGYTALYKNHLDHMIISALSNTNYTVQPESYT